MSDPKNAYPYPAQGYYQGPPVMAPPKYHDAPPLGRDSGSRDALQLGVFAALCNGVAATPPAYSTLLGE